MFEVSADICCLMIVVIRETQSCDKASNLSCVHADIYECELRSLKNMLNGLCWDDDYTIAQWLEHRWLQARVPGSSPGGDSQFFLQTFPVFIFPSN